MKKKDLVEDLVSKSCKDSIKELLIQWKPDAIFLIFSSILNIQVVDQEVIKHILKKHSLSIRDKCLNKYNSIKDNFNNCFDEELANEVYNEYLQHIISIDDSISLRKGILDIFQLTKKYNIKTVIVSNIDRQLLNAFFDKCKLRPLIDLQISNDQKAIVSTCDSLGFNLSKESILFISDSLADMSIAFQLKLTPKIFIQTENEDLNNQRYQFLQSINLDNPIRLIHEYTELIELFERSHILWGKEKIITKIVYIGAGGNIDKQAIPKICDVIPFDADAEIVLIGSGCEESLSRLRRFSEGISGALNCCTDQRKRIKFTITNDMSNVVNSKIVLCSAGKWPSVELSNKFAVIDPTGRTKQSFINQSMIEDIAQQVQQTKLIWCVELPD